MKKKVFISKKDYGATDFNIFTLNSKVIGAFVFIEDIHLNSLWLLAAWDYSSKRWSRHGAWGYRLQIGVERGEDHVQLI